MAGTADDPITLDERVLLRDVRDLVARYGKMEKDAAGDLALSYIRKHPPRHYGWYQAEDSMRGIGPSVWGTVTRFHYCAVDRRPPEDPYGLDAALGDLLAEFIDQCPDAEQISQVYLYRDYVLAMLQAFGFSLPSSLTTAQSPSSPSSSTTELIPTPAKLNGLERWVYDEMKNDPPRKGKKNIPSGFGSAALTRTPSS
jgi:hypothetical protein